MPKKDNSLTSEPTVAITGHPQYDAWMVDPSPDNMAKVVESLEPAINSEIQRYSGPKPLLRSKAKTLAIQAVKKYDPSRGAQLRSWVVTQMQPLSRYGQQLRPIHASEMAIRQAAELNRVSNELSDDIGHIPTHEELADETGLSVKRIKMLRRTVIPVVSEGTLAGNVTEDEGPNLPGTNQSNVLGNAEEIVYDSLNDRDKSIYDWKIGKHGKSVLSNMEIAKRLGVTPALISQRSEQVASQIRDLAMRKGG